MCKITESKIIILIIKEKKHYVNFVKLQIKSYRFNMKIYQTFT